MNQNKAHIVGNLIDLIIEKSPGVFENELIWESISTRDLKLELRGATMVHVSHSTIDIEENLCDLYLWFVTFDAKLAVVHICPVEGTDDYSTYTNIERAYVI